ELQGVDPIGESRSEGQQLVIWVPVHIGNRERELRGGIGRDGPRKVLEEVILAIPIRVSPRQGVSIVLPEILDLPPVGHSVAGINAEVILSDVRTIRPSVAILLW